MDPQCLLHSLATIVNVDGVVSMYPLQRTPKGPGTIFLCLELWWSVCSFATHLAIAKCGYYHFNIKLKIVNIAAFFMTPVITSMLST